MSFPVPKATIASEIRFSPNVLPEDRLLWLIASPDGWELLEQDPRGLGSGRKWSRKPNERNYSIVWWGSWWGRERGIATGDTLRFELVASEAVARDDPTVSGYMDLRIERSVSVTTYASDE